MKNLWSYKLTSIVILLILYAILMPSDSVPSVSIPGIDKVVHAGMFFVLTATFFLEHFLATNKLPKLLITLCSIFTFALSTELMQGLLTSSRACDPKDLLADMIGTLIALILWHILFKYFPSFINLFHKQKS